MGRYVTPAGVVIVMAEKAALAVGYKPEAVPENEKPKRKPGRPKKSE